MPNDENCGYFQTSYVNGSFSGSVAAVSRQCDSGMATGLHIVQNEDGWSFHLFKKKKKRLIFASDKKDLPVRGTGILFSWAIYAIVIRGCPRLGR